MKLNAPKKITAIIAIVLAVAGIVLFFLPCAKECTSVGGCCLPFWTEVAAFVVLCAGNFIKGL